MRYIDVIAESPIASQRRNRRKRAHRTKLEPYTSGVFYFLLNSSHARLNSSHAKLNSSHARQLNSTQLLVSSRKAIASSLGSRKAIEALLSVGLHFLGLLHDFVQARKDREVVAVAASRGIDDEDRIGPLSAEMAPCVHVIKERSLDASLASRNLPAAGAHHDARF